MVEGIMAGMLKTAYKRRARIGMGFLATCALSWGAAVTPLGSRGYGIIPAPQSVELTGADVRFGRAWTLELGPGVKRNDVAVETLLEELQTRFGIGAPASVATGTRVRLSMAPGTVAIGPATDRDKEAIARQAYRLDIGADGITVAANAPEGLFYAVESLAQLLQRRGESLQLPQCRITDWPDLHLRHIYWDNAHHLERLPELKRAIRQAAFFKINGFELKLEGHFQFPSAPSIVEPYAMTPTEYQELTDYGLRYHVQLVPWMDGPAHIAFIVKHPEYARYRSFPDSNYELCATNPEAVQFLAGLFRDLLAANRGGKFVRLSTDEAYYIGLAENAHCNEKSAAADAGSVGKLLARFIDQVATPLHESGRTVLFWGEYPLKPGDIEALPPFLVNGEVYGPEYDPVYRKRGIQQMIYTYTQGDESRSFSPTTSRSRTRGEFTPYRFGRTGFEAGSARSRIRRRDGTPDLIGVVVAGWGDSGLHPETFWLGYATITAAGWHPARRRWTRRPRRSTEFLRRRGPAHGSRVPADEPAIALFAGQLGMETV